MADDGSDTTSTSSSSVSGTPLVLGGGLHPGISVTSSEDSDSSGENDAAGAALRSFAPVGGNSPTRLSDAGSSSASPSRQTSSKATTPNAKKRGNLKSTGSASSSPKHASFQESGSAAASSGQKQKESFWTEEDSGDDSPMHKEETPSFHTATKSAAKLELPSRQAADVLLASPKASPRLNSPSRQAADAMLTSNLVMLPSPRSSPQPSPPAAVSARQFLEEADSARGTSSRPDRADAKPARSDAERTSNEEMQKRMDDLRRQEEEAEQRLLQARKDQERVQLQQEEERLHSQELQEQEAQKRLQSHQEQQRLKMQEEQRKKAEEERAMQLKLQEEDVRRKEVEARRREEEAQKIKQEAIVKRKEEEARRKAEEAKAIKLQEDAFWATLSPAEAERMRGMLQAVALYQQQLQQNDQVLAGLHEEVKSKEKTYQGFKQRVHQASRNVELAQEQDKMAKSELARWSKKREQYEGCAPDLGSLRTRHHTSRQECARLEEQHGPVQAEVTSLREKLAASDESSSSMATRLIALKAKCQQTVASQKAEHVEELAGMRAQQTEELSKLDVDAQNQLGKLWVQHAQDASALRLSLDEAERRREKLRQDRNFTTDQFLEAQREGQRLQRSFADARQEVLEMSAQLKASSLQNSRTVETPVAPTRSRSLTQLGSRSALASPAADTGSERAQVSAELNSFRRRCKALEKEATRTHDALEKKQTACERWRRLSLEHGNQSSSLSFVSGKSGPFTLGPVENAADLKLLSPNGTQAL